MPVIACKSTFFSLFYQENMAFLWKCDYNRSIGLLFYLHFRIYRAYNYALPRQGMNFFQNDIRRLWFGLSHAIGRRLPFAVKQKLGFLAMANSIASSALGCFNLLARSSEMLFAEVVSSALPASSLPSFA